MLSPLSLTTLPKKHTGDVVFTQEECQALAQRLGVLAVDSLRGDYTLLRQGKVWKLRATVEAHLTQTCVVTLEPFVQTQREEFSCFVGEPAALETLSEEDRADAEEAPGGLFDVGEVLVQYLSLALEPYPKI